MDPTKPSLSTKMPYVNNGEFESVMKEMVQRQDSLNGEKQKDAETRETDVVDGLPMDAAQRRGKTKVKAVTDFATLSKVNTSGNKSRAPLKQVFGSQGVSTSEAFAVPANLSWSWKEEAQGTALESSWTELVTSHTTMAKKQRHQQAALWEFVQTELIYINKLKIIKDLVIGALVHLHQSDVLQEVRPNQLFSNLPSILQAHQLFWQEVVYPMLQEVRRTGKPFDPLRLEAGFLQFHERFLAYHHYCWEEENNLEFTRKQMESNPHFLAFVQWVEKHPQGERMRLGDMQAKPHQRITKYPLLLKAVLKETQEPHVQRVLRAMLTTVNSFLESINDFMQYKDEQLALYISAQRIEGYEVEGINEEIDKIVRDVCHFDLTCPIRGAGSKVVRKLLLEDNLKIRGYKTEVVALLFSDVLLLTKVQKKAERLKVVRPPLALDRMNCVPLKDGNSLVLVEVGELQCINNVTILVTSNPETCSSWVNTIKSAKETLLAMRKQEDNRLDNVRSHERETKASVDVKNDDMEEEEQPPTQSKLINELTDVINKSPTVNGSEEADPDQMSPKTTGLPPKIPYRVMRRNIPTRQPGRKEQEWIEMRTRRKHWEENEKIIETPMMNTKSTLRTHGELNVSKLNHFSQNEAGLGIHNPKRQPVRLIDELPAVDYPTDEEVTFQVPHEPKIMSRPQFGKPPILMRSHSDIQLVQQDASRIASSSQFGDPGTPPDGTGFPQNLKSPGLRKRRPSSTGQGPPTPTSNFLNEPTLTQTAPEGSNSECSMQVKRSSLPTKFDLDVQRGVSQKLTKSKQAPIPYPKYYSDGEAFSESELSGSKFHSKKFKFKELRSSSSPNVLTRGGQRPHRPSDSSYPSHKEEETPKSAYSPKERTSRVEGVLERAKERTKDKAGIKRDKQLQTNLQYLRPSSPFNSAPSPTPSEAGNETDLEEVALIRPRTLTVSTVWKEQLVDGDEDDKSSGLVGNTSPV
ncbi:hypothetical protein CCH79_00010921 [Gambusia affinis]|uniref:DH domain-containing protein n=1 Tax=Gambusia affinis TaxID=33528 RepID=A0A315VKT2_GAMAF|nr:hypothetical protein CCH79_00010921 [Gambusia affinis]